MSVEVNYGIRFTTNDELEQFLKQLCHEVHNRLMEIKRRGKTITLKYMIRSKDAPIETAKFMGHGICDYLTKSLSLSDFTCSLDTIIKTVLNIKTILNISPNELRGIGIHISRLDNDCSASVSLGGGGGANGGSNDINILKTMFNKFMEKNVQKSTTIISSDNHHHQTNTTIITKENLPKTFEVPQKNVENKISLRNGKKVMVSNSIKTKGKIRGSSGNSKVKQKQFKGTRNVSTMLANIKQNSIKTNVSSISSDDQTLFLSDNNIDINVLMELPENIRKEIIREYKPTLINDKTNNNSKKNPNVNVDNRECIDAEFLAALPLDIRNELLIQEDRKKIISLSPIKQKTICNNNNIPAVLQSPKKQQICDSAPKPNTSTSSTTTIQLISQDNILVDLNWRKILKEWTESTDEPLLCDIEIIEEYAIELVLGKKLNELYVVLRYLFR